MHDSLIPTYSNLGGGLRNKARGEERCFMQRNI